MISDHGLVVWVCPSATINILHVSIPCNRQKICPARQENKCLGSVYHPSRPAEQTSLFLYLHYTINITCSLPLLFCFFQRPSKNAHVNSLLQKCVKINFSTQITTPCVRFHFSFFAFFFNLSFEISFLICKVPGGVQSELTLIKFLYYRSRPRARCVVQIKTIDGSENYWN